MTNYGEVVTYLTCSLQYFPASLKSKMLAFLDFFNLPPVSLSVEPVVPVVDVVEKAKAVALDWRRSGPVKLVEVFARRWERMRAIKFN